MKAGSDSLQPTAESQIGSAQKRRRSLALATALAGLVLSAGLCASLLLLLAALSREDGGLGWPLRAGEPTANEAAKENGDTGGVEAADAETDADADADAADADAAVAADATAGTTSGSTQSAAESESAAASPFETDGTKPPPSETDSAEARASSPDPAAALPSASPRRVTATPAPPLAGTPLPGAVDWPDLPDLKEREAITSTANFRLFAADPEDPWLADQAGRWARELEPLFEDVSQQFGGRALPRPPVDLAFVRAYAARCPARGLAATAQDPPLLLVFVDEETSDRQIRAVLAHEMAHHISLDGRFVGDGVLTEGIANWGGGRHTLKWQGFAGWHDAVEAYREQGNYVSISDDSGLRPRPGEACLVRRDRVYNIRTAFVDWLIGRIGLDRVLAMPTLEVLVPTEEGSEERVERLPDYEAVTGLDLAGLERLWLRELDRWRGIEAAALAPGRTGMARSRHSAWQRAGSALGVRAFFGF